MLPLEEFGLPTLLCLLSMELSQFRRVPFRNCTAKRLAHQLNYAHTGHRQVTRVNRSSGEDGHRPLGLSALRTPH